MMRRRYALTAVPDADACCDAAMQYHTMTVARRCRITREERAPPYAIAYRSAFTSRCRADGAFGGDAPIVNIFIDIFNARPSAGELFMSFTWTPPRA